MGVLITAIGAWVTQFISTLLLGVSKKAFVYAYVGAYVVLTVVFINSINGLLPNLISAGTPGGFVQAGLSLIPSNVPACIAAVGAAHLARWVFVWQAKFIKSWMVD
jgi:hypothetical protein